MTRLHRKVIYQETWISYTFVFNSNYSYGHYYYRPQCSCSKVIFSQASVILSRGVYPSMHWGRHPPGRHPAPWADIPWAVHAGIHTPTQYMLGCTPLAQCMLGRTPPQLPLLWMVHILLECILVTGRNKVVAKVMFLQVSVILSTGEGPAGRTPQQGDPPGKETPQARRPPGQGNPPGKETPWQGDPPQQGDPPAYGQ